MHIPEEKEERKKKTSPFRKLMNGSSTDKNVRLTFKKENSSIVESQIPRVSSGPFISRILYIPLLQVTKPLRKRRKRHNIHIILFEIAFENPKFLLARQAFQSFF